MNLREFANCFQRNATQSIWDKKQSAMTPMINEMHGSGVSCPPCPNACRVPDLAPDQYFIGVFFCNFESFVRKKIWNNPLGMKRGRIELYYMFCILLNLISFTFSNMFSLPLWSLVLFLSVSFLSLILLLFVHPLCTSTSLPWVMSLYLTL